MSSVLTRFRSESALEFYTTARKLRGQLTRWAMNEKNIPKHYRPVLAFPLLARLDDLMNNITAANSIYPANEHEAFYSCFGRWPYTKKEMKKYGLFDFG